MKEYAFRLNKLLLNLAHLPGYQYLISALFVWFWYMSLILQADLLNLCHLHGPAHLRQLPRCVVRGDGDSQ